MNLFLILSYASLLTWIVVPLVTLVQCWQNAAMPRERKIVWTVILIVTWPLLGAGAMAYGLIHYTGWRKCVPLLLILVTFGLFTYKTILGPQDMYASLTSDNLGAIIKVVGESELSKQEKMAVTSRLSLLRAEIDMHAGDTVIVAKNIDLAKYLELIVTNGHDPDELKKWMDMVDARETLTPEQTGAALKDYLSAKAAKE